MVLAAEVKGASRPTDSLRSPLTSAPKTKSRLAIGEAERVVAQTYVLSGRGVVKEGYVPLRFGQSLRLAELSPAEWCTSSLCN